MSCYIFIDFFLVDWLTYIFPLLIHFGQKHFPYQSHFVVGERRTASERLGRLSNHDHKAKKALGKSTYDKHSHFWVRQGNFEVYKIIARLRFLLFMSSMIYSVFFFLHDTWFFGYCVLQSLKLLLHLIVFDNLLLWIPWVLLEGLLDLPFKFWQRPTSTRLFTTSSNQFGTRQQNFSRLYRCAIRHSETLARY